MVPRAGIEPSALARFVLCQFCALGVPVRTPDTYWCLEPESNRHAAFQQAADFKSAVSTNFTIEASRHCETKTKQPRQRGVVGAAKLEARGGVEPPFTDLQSGA
jgi:hypothetical protein